MADRVSLSEVQGWLEQTKLTLVSIDAELHNAAVDMVFSALGTSYDTTVWTNAASTPNLVRKIIAMLIAAWQYDRQYSEDSDEASWYATKLEKRAMALLAGLASGSVDLPGVDPVEGSSSPSFYPDDATGAGYIYDGMGLQVGPQGSEDIKFTMGAVF